MLCQNTVSGFAVSTLLLRLCVARLHHQGTKSTAGHVQGSSLLQLHTVVRAPASLAADREAILSSARPLEEISHIRSNESWLPFQADTRGIKRNCSGHADCMLGLYSAVIGLHGPAKFGQNWSADISMCILAFCVAGVSLAAGVGGGGLFVPLLMMILSLDSKVATAISQAMLFGGALSAFAYNIRGSHPSKPARPLINFELACLIGSALVAGAQIGSVVHAFAPPALILLLLCIVLLDAARKGVNNALKIQAKESEATTEEKPSDVEVVAEDEHAEKVWSHTFDSQMRLFLVWLLCMALVVSKGLLVEICSPAWWFLTAAAVLILSGCAYLFASKLKVQDPVDEDDLDFRQLAMPLMRISFMAGALAALCGIGGGMVMGPILVEMKVPPQVSSATTATTLLVLSSSTALVYLCRGVAPGDYMMVLFFCTLAGAMVGKLVVGMWVRRTGRQSLIVWTLVIVTVLSTILMGYEGMSRILEKGREAFWFTSLCHNKVILPSEEYLSAES